MNLSGLLSRRKCQKGKYPSKFSKRAINCVYSKYGVKSIERGFITFAQMEAIRLVVSRAFKRRARLIFRVCPNVSRTRKPVEVRMGKGKGSISHWVFKVSPGRIIFEVKLREQTLANVRTALRVAASKLSFKTKILA